MRLQKPYLVALIFIGAAASRGQMQTAPTLIVPPPALSAPIPKKTQPVAAAAASADAPQTIRVSGGVMAGNLLTKVMPACPSEAIEQHVSCSAVLHVIIGADGRVMSAAAISGAEMVRSALIDAVKQWTYKPYQLNGNPVAVDTTVTIHIQQNGG